MPAKQHMGSNERSLLPRKLGHSRALCRLVSHGIIAALAAEAQPQHYPEAIGIQCKNRSFPGKEHDLFSARAANARELAEKLERLARRH